MTGVSVTRNKMVTKDVPYEWTEMQRVTKTVKQPVVHVKQVMKDVPYEWTEMQQVQFTRSVERAMALLEPIIILTLSVLVGSIVITLMSAVVSMNDLAV